MIIQEANYVKRQIASTLGHTSNIVFTNDNPDEEVSLAMTGIPPLSYKMVPGKVEDYIFEGHAANQVLRWDEDNKCLVKINNRPAVKGIFHTFHLHYILTVHMM